MDAKTETLDPNLIARFAEIVGERYALTTETDVF